MEVGAGVPGPFGYEDHASGGHGDREVLNGPGGQVAALAHGCVVGVCLGDCTEPVEQGKCVLGARGEAYVEESLPVRRGLRGWLLRWGPGGGGVGMRAEGR